MAMTRPSRWAEVPCTCAWALTPAAQAIRSRRALFWSEGQNPLDRWSLFVVEAWAQGDEVTVYTWSAPESPTVHNEVWWDDAALTIVSP